MILGVSAELLALVTLAGTTGVGMRTPPSTRDEEYKFSGAFTYIRANTRSVTLLLNHSCGAKWSMYVKSVKFHHPRAH
jgi:hypothetical protein